MRIIRTNLDQFTLHDGRNLYLLAQGRLVNLAAAEGHPSEVMDMSFANQALCIKHIVQEPELQSQVYPVPDEIDRYVARIKLLEMGVEIDELTDEQKHYLTSWEVGTR
jgi:adenosylhomocysteinase